MKNKYDSHNYKMGQYDLTQISKFATKGEILLEDIEWRITNVGGMVSKDLGLLIDGLFEVIKGKKDDLPQSQKKVVSDAILKQSSGKNSLPISINRWEEELKFYYDNGLIVPTLAQKRIASGEATLEETRWAYNNKLVDSRFVNGRLEFDHDKIPFGEIDMMYEFDLVGSDYVNKRLRTQPDTTSFGEIDMMYKHRLINPQIIEERIARGPSIGEYENIERFYPEISKKHAGKKEAMQKKINYIFDRLKKD